MQQNKALPDELAASIPLLALPHVFSQVAAANLPALQAALQFSDLWQEFYILQRLYYKNKNQHKASKHLQGVGQVCKILKLFNQLQLPDLVQELHAAAQRTSLPEAAQDTAAGAAAGGRSKRRHQQLHDLQQEHNACVSRQTVLLPSFQAGCWVLRRLLAGCQMLLTCNSAILSAAEHLSGQLSYGYFMPFCLVAVACLARLRVLAVNSLMQLLQAYNSIMALLPLLPVQTAHATPAQGMYATNRNSSSSQQLWGDPCSCQDLPQMLTLSWQGPIPHLQSIPFNTDDSIAARAAQLQETFCISQPSAPAAVAAATAANGRRDAGGFDLGESIGREEFESLLLLRRQQQEPVSAPAAAALQQKPLAEILVFEDREAVLPLAAATESSRQPEPPAGAGVPKYITAQGTGLGLGLGLSLGIELPCGAQQQQQQQQQPPGIILVQPVQAAAAGPGPTASAAVSKPVVVDNSMGPEDLFEFTALYGTDSFKPDAQQQQAAAAAAGTEGGGPLLPSQVPSRGAVAVKRQRLGDSASAALAMQGHGSSSDDEMEDVAVPPVHVHTAVGTAAAMTAQLGPGLIVEEQQQPEHNPLDQQAATCPGAFAAHPSQASAKVGPPVVVTGQRSSLSTVAVPITAADVEPQLKALAAVAHAAEVSAPAGATDDIPLLPQQQKEGSQHHQAMDIDHPAAPVRKAGSTGMEPAPLAVRKKAVKHEAAKKREQQQETVQQDWVEQLLTSSTTAAADVRRPHTPLVAPAGAVVSGATPGAAASAGGHRSSKGKKSKKAGSKQGSRSSAGEGGSSSEAAGGRDPILDMLLEGL